MTSDVFESFRAFCEPRACRPTRSASGSVTTRASRELLIGLETGELAEAEFEPRFAAILGVAAPGLIDRLFAGGRPTKRCSAPCAARAPAGIRTGLISNSWGTRRYDRALLAELFDGVVISGEVGMRKPTPEIYELGAERIGARARASACSSTTCRSTSSRRPSWGWRPSTTAMPSRRSPSSSVCSPWICDEALHTPAGARDARGAGRAAPWRAAAAARCRPSQLRARATPICKLAARRLSAIPAPALPSGGARFLKPGDRGARSRALTAADAALDRRSRRARRHRGRAGSASLHAAGTASRQRSGGGDQDPPAAARATRGPSRRGLALARRPGVREPLARSAPAAHARSVALLASALAAQAVGCLRAALVTTLGSAAKSSAGPNAWPGRRRSE